MWEEERSKGKGVEKESENKGRKQRGKRVRVGKREGKELGEVLGG